MELENKLAPVKKECFGKNKNHSLLSVDKCLSKSKDYLEMKKIIKRGKKSIENCIIQKCVKKTKANRGSKSRFVKKRKSNSIRKHKPRSVKRRKGQK